MVTAPNDDWTEELCIRLIHEYRKRPLLWDPKDPFFFKKTMKPELWDEIGAALNMPPEICKHKMVILQSSFRREKSKILQSIRDSADDAKYTTTWFAFEEMAFLIDKETERKRQSRGVQEDSCEEVSSIKRSLLEHYEKNNGDCKKKKFNQSTYSKIGTVLPNISPQPIQVNTSAAPATEPINTASTPIPPLVPVRPREETLEEIKSFTNFIAYKMKKYSETTKNSVQQAICDIIFKADQNYYETVPFDDGFRIQNPNNDMATEDLDEKTIDIGYGQTIKLQMDDSD